MINSYILYTEKLKGEYKEAFSKIDMYVGTNYIDELSKEEMMSNLLDIFLTAQEEGRPIEKITGKNIEQFCKNFCSGYGLKEWLIRFFEDIKGWVLLLFGISTLDMIILLLEYLEGAEVSFFTYRTEFNIAFYGLFMLLIYFINSMLGFVVRRVMFRCKKIMRTLLNVIREITLLILLVLVFVFADKVEATMLPTWICFIVSGLLMIIYRVALRERREQRRENKISFWDYCAPQKNEQYAVELEKKIFFKRNRRRMKRGCAPLSKEEHLKAELERTKRLNKPYYYVVIPIVIVGIAVTWMYFTNQFESFIDMGVFLSLIAIVEIFAMKACWKFQKRANDERISRIESELSNPTSWEE